MTYQYTPRHSDPYTPRERSFPARSSPRRASSASELLHSLRSLTPIHLALLTLALAIAVAYARPLLRLAKSFAYDPLGTVEGVIEMVGYKVTGLFAHLGETKHDWSQTTDQSDSDRDPGKPVRRYKDILPAKVEPGEWLRGVLFVLRRVVWLMRAGSRWEGAFYPGLLNAAGNLCFLNATLQVSYSLSPLFRRCWVGSHAHYGLYAPQAMASTSPLIRHLETLSQLSTLTSTPVPVTRSLLLTLSSLNTPGSRPRSLRPLELAQALAGASDRNRRLMASADQQDAHELWVMIREAVEDESHKVEKARRTAGAQGLASLLGLGMGVKAGEVARRVGEKDPYLHLMSQRVRCLVCGYTRDVRHTVEELVGVIVPPVVSSIAPWNVRM